MLKKMYQYKLTIISVVLILIAVLMPGSDVPSVGIPNIDKVVHAGMFGVLTLCFYGEYTWSNKRMPSLFLPALIIEAFALSTEFMQNFASGRSCDMKDFAADSVGIIAVILIFYRVYKRKVKS